MQFGNQTVLLIAAARCCPRSLIIKTLGGLPIAAVALNISPGIKQFGLRAFVLQAIGDSLSLLQQGRGLGPASRLREGISKIVEEFDHVGTAVACCAIA